MIRCFFVQKIFNDLFNFDWRSLFVKHWIELFDSSKVYFTHRLLLGILKWFIEKVFNSISEKNVKFVLVGYDKFCVSTKKRNGVDNLV